MSGIIIGSMFGPPGAIIGGIIGTGIWAGKLYAPKAISTIKNGAYKLYDKSTEKIGSAVKKGWKFIKKPIA